MRAVLRAILGKMASIFPKFSRRPLKIPKSEFYTLKIRRAYHTITLLWKCCPPPPPPPGGQHKNHYEQCIKTLKEKRDIPRDLHIQEILSVYHTMTHQPHESVADFTHRFSETQDELDKLIPEIKMTAGKEIELIFAAKFRKNSFPENSNLTNCKTL